MSPSPLQLERYHFREIHWESAESAKPETEASLATRLNCGRNKQNPRKWRVELAVRFGNEADATPTPYRGSVTVEAFFAVHPDYPEDKIAPLIEVTAASIVYGVIRECISNLTARGPYGMYILPSVSFVQKPAPALPKTEEQSKARIPKRVKAAKKR